MKRCFLFLPRLAASAAATGQEPETPTFSENAGAEYVMLPVLVTDKKGAFVEGLRKEDFLVRVGDSPVAFDTFERDQSAPVSFAFLLDTSGSMGTGGKLESAKNAIRSILRNDWPATTSRSSRIRTPTSCRCVRSKPRTVSRKSSAARLTRERVSSPHTRRSARIFRAPALRLSRS